jgi:DNA-directed RNA polymerase specialized sigma subunit
MDETDRWLNSPQVIDILVIQMLRRIHDPKNKFIFSMCFLLNYSEKDVADCLSINETNVCRRIKSIRKRLENYKKGYDFNSSKEVIHFKS